jgi:hypothetical protein
MFRTRLLLLLFPGHTTTHLHSTLLAAKESHGRGSVIIDALRVVRRLGRPAVVRPASLFPQPPVRSLPACM